MNNTTITSGGVSTSSLSSEVMNILTVILGLTAVIANGMILLLTRFNPILRKDAKQLQAALAVADLILGLGAIAATVDGWRRKYLNNWYTIYFCLFIGMPKLFGDAFSLTITFAMSLERFIAIVFPMLYRNLNKTVFSLVLILSSLAICVTFSLMGLYGIDTSKKPNSCGGSGNRIDALKPMLSYFNCTVGSAVVLLYVAIVLFIQKQSKMFARSSRTRGDVSNEHVFRREVEATRVVIVIVLGCIIFYVIPNITIAIMTAVGSSFSFGSYVSGFSLCNGTVNFFLYMWKDVKMRKAFLHWKRNEKPTMVSSHKTEPTHTRNNVEMATVSRSTGLTNNRISDVYCGK